MLLLLLEPLAILALVSLWAWALCAVLARQESYAWLVGILLLPPVGLPLYLVNRCSGGFIDRQAQRIQHRARIRELVLLCEENGTFDRRLELANLLFSEGEYRDALVHLDHAMTIHDEDRRVQFLAARALVALDRAAAALPHGEFVLDQDPTYATGDAALLVARIHTDAGRPDSAIQVLARTAARQQVPTVVLRLAELLVQAGRRDEARTALTSLLDLAALDGVPLRAPQQRKALAKARSLHATLKA